MARDSCIVLTKRNIDLLNSKNPKKGGILHQSLKIFKFHNINVFISNAIGCSFYLHCIFFQPLQCPGSTRVRGLRLEAICVYS